MQSGSTLCARTCAASIPERRNQNAVRRRGCEIVLRGETDRVSATLWSMSVMVNFQTP